MSDNDAIDEIMKKVFKREYNALDKYQSLVEQKEVPITDLLIQYAEVVESYRLLLHDAVKITKIGDINQKKLFDVNTELEKQKKLLYLISISDPLTEIYNRTYLMQVLVKEFARSERYDHTFSCILIDIDNFKGINDNYGHQVGDEALINVASTIKNELREVDSFGRYGGEEFMIILPNINASGAEIVAEKIRIKIGNNTFQIKNHQIRITISQGISDSSIDNPKTEDDLLYKTDTALYQAKRQGKNCSVVFQANAESAFQS